MSAVIQNLLLRKRQRDVDASERQRFIAEAKGERGDPGPQGETGPMPSHEWQGTKLRFEQPDGTWGKLTDLKGEPGKEGAAGRTVVVARGGGSSGGMGSLLPGAPNTEPTGIAVVQGERWVNLSWTSFIQIIAGAVDMGAELSRRSDFVGESIIYRGEAAPGSLESDSVWRIKKITFVVDADGKQDIDEKWAGGNADFTNAWSARTSLEYI